MMELNRALENRSLAVSTVQEKGRSLFTNRDFYPGEVIISQEPYVCVPTHKRCDGCLATTNLSKCSRCQLVWYCGTPCQKSEWKKLQDEKIIPTTAMDNYKLVEALVAHMSDIKEEQLVLYAQMANLVHLILQWPEINIKEIAEIFSKFACNAHTICDSELRPLGTGLYPVVSVINHSCLPNSVLVFEGTVASVRALQHVPKGTEVLISYIETAGSTVTRQKALKGQYLFTCVCSRCSKVGQYEDVQENAILEGYRCKNEICDGFLLRTTDGKAFQCEECGLVRDKEEIKQIATEIKLLSEEASKPSSSDDYQDAISIYKMIEKLQTKLYHPFSINLMQTRDNFEVTNEAGTLDGSFSILQIDHTNLSKYVILKLVSSINNKIRSFLSIDSVDRVYPAVHPLLGLQHYTCGKLEWYLGDTDEAVKSLTKAVDILRITHGTNTPFLKELLMMLEEARAEASFKLSSKEEWNTS
ncbi:hypothetical protein P8452_21348 [Trifolium repens]|nr:hypothetical protein P8452_21348 [Trifolium repens]